MRPTFRNLTDSFEGWAYRNGLTRQLYELERQKFLESTVAARKQAGVSERVLRLTETGRLRALGGRDPESRWRRDWDGRWRLVLFDLPVAHGTARDRLRRNLRRCGFGYLQNSVWISPDPLGEEMASLVSSRASVESLVLLEARPCAGETDEEIVAGAWDFDAINRHYAKHLQVLEARPTGVLNDLAATRALHKWAGEERAAWLTAVTGDPLLPEVLLPRGYLGRKAWELRVKTLGKAGNQMRSFVRAAAAARPA